MKYVKIFVGAIAAGLCIGLGGTIYLSCLRLASVNNDLLKVIGAFLFATGLFAICTYEFSLFTGKVGYLVNNKVSYLLDLLVIIIGNLIGTMLFACLVLFTRDGKVLSDISATLVNVKLSDNYLSILLLSIPCGFLMHFAVYTFKKLDSNLVARYIPVFLGVALFILCGFEHVIANFFYFTLAHAWSWKAVLLVLLMTLGNGIGGVLIPLYEKFKEWSNKENDTKQN